jgi:CheY-like chemotaxis protein
VVAETTCLITDFQMPGLSGLELQDALRSRGMSHPRNFDYGVVARRLTAKPCVLGLAPVKPDSSQARAA